MSRMGERLVEAMQEALDHSEGKIELRTSRIPVVPVRETISADEIRETRKGLGMSQGVFAMTIGVSRKTVESWETGRYMPDGAARRLITIMQTDPTFPEKYGIVRA
ncbi:MAG: helix-turn-helix domain-containing protein [Oscillospiraceae bacterium]|nr:helix-turn-helix domain-containing protein [Oscillospiraceae bacterium]